MNIQFFQQYLLKRLSFPHCEEDTSWHYCQNSFDHICKGLFPSCLLYSISLFVCLYASTKLFDYCSFIIYFKIRKRESFNLVLLSQNCFDYLGSLEITYEF